MSILGFLNKASGIIGNGRVAINDLKILGDKTQDLLNNITSIYNSAINSPIETPNQNQGFNNGGFMQQNNGFVPSQGFGSGAGFNPPQQGFGTPAMTPGNIIGNGMQNTFKRSFAIENINTLADALDAVAGQKNFDITYGSYGRDAVKPAYTVAPNIFLIYTNGRPTLHFNIDARSKRLRDDKKIKIMESISAILTFIDTMFKMCSTQGSFYNISMIDSNVLVDIEGVKFGIGTLTLMKYKLGITGYAYGSTVSVDGYNIAISGDFINIFKDGFTPFNIRKEKFIQLLNDIPALKYTNLTNDEFIEYQDNPKGLTTRIIIELNRNTNEYEIITYSDVQFLDTYAGTQIKNSVLGQELKRSEGATIV